MKEFKDILKEKRVQKKTSQFSLALELGVSQSRVALWEVGKHLPRADLLVRLADFFGCTLDELMGREFEKGGDNDA